jgi:hypothetical protein
LVRVFRTLARSQRKPRETRRNEPPNRHGTRRSSTRARSG